VHPTADPSFLQQDPPITTEWLPIQVPSDTNTKICQRVVQLLQDLAAIVNRMPSDVLTATPGYRLSVFAVDPSNCVAKPGEDDWLIINAMLKSSFGLDGFIINFMRFFVVARGLDGVMFEMKVEALVKELDSW